MTVATPDSFLQECQELGMNYIHFYLQISDWVSDTYNPDDVYIRDLTSMMELFCEKYLTAFKR